MTAPLRVLHVASEVTPFSKTGGLAEVVAALPRALRAHGVAPFVITPRYRSMDEAAHPLARRLEPLVVTLGARTERVVVYEAMLPGGTVPIFLLGHPLFDVDDPYVGPDGAGDHPDNGLRFALLCRAALELAHTYDLWPDLVHAHDWQGALALAYAKRESFLDRPIPRTLLTIHNLAFQGLFPTTVLGEVGLGWDLYHPDRAEFYGQISFLKAGIAYADRITTVSPRYAREIQSQEHGAGLDGFLRHHAPRLTGVLNGVDTEVWNPARDPYLAARYDADDLAGKAACKAALLKELGLPGRVTLPVIASISRLTEQKGFDLIAEAGEELARLDALWVFLGNGEKRYTDALERLARRFPGKVAVRFGQDEALSHRVIAGADLFLMPSRFEPCGLGQLQALRYGTLPIVRAVGGLDDTVVDWDERTATGNGFKFEEYTARALVTAVLRAIATTKKRDAWNQLVVRALRNEVGWDARARIYAELYRQTAQRATAATAAT